MKKQCPRCNRKIESKFSFCPYCGIPTKPKNNEFGILGKTDTINEINNQIKIPFGMDKIMNSLIRQLEKQMGSMNFTDNPKMPKGIKIQIARHPMEMQNIQEEKQIIKNVQPKISEKEATRRMSLKKKEAESKVRRLGDNIIYEMKTPGVKKQEDVSITELASGFEIKAYSSDICYTKFIPIKTESMDYFVEKDKVSIELKA